MFSNRDLAKLLTPLIIEQFFAMFVGMLDTLMVSSAGEAAISGVSLVNEVNFLMFTILAALGGGGSVVAAQYLGARRPKEANRAASQLMMLGTIFGLALMALCLIGRRWILETLYGSASEDVIDAAVTYFWITALSFPLLGIYNSSTAIYRIINRTQVTMWVSLLMNLINVSGNYFCIYHLHMGVAGVAWPTTISRTVAALIMAVLAFHKKNPVHADLPDVFSWHQMILKKIISIALPNGIENGLFQIGRVIVASIVATYGTTMIAANGVANSLYNLIIIVSVGINLGIVTVVGRCVGANRYDQARYYTRKLMILNLFLSALNGLAVWITLPLFLQFYSISPEGADVVRQVIFYSCFTVALLNPHSFTLPNAIRAAGDAKYTMIVGVLSMFLARITGAYLMGTLLGLKVVGIYLAMYLDWVVRAIFFYLRYRSGKWTRFRLVE